MSRHNKNRRRDRQPSQRNGNGHEATYRYTEPPPPPVVTDFSQMRISDFLTPGPTPPPRADHDQASDDENRSRFNALKLALRSKILFPFPIMNAIDDAARGFALATHPSNPLEDFFVWEMARGSVQSKLCGEQLVVNLSLAAQRAKTTRWCDDRRADADRLGARLSDASDRVKGALERTKYGTLYLIEKLIDLGDVVSTHGCLTEEQRQRLGDLFGIEPLVRDGCKRLPPAGDGEALAAAIAREVAKHQKNLERNLDERDREEAHGVSMGIVRYPDQETRRLKSDQARADRRFQWAWEALRMVQSGVDPATIIDPETKKPVTPGPRPACRPEPARPADPPTQSQSQPQPPPQAAAEDTSASSASPPEPTPNLPPFPEGYPAESYESLMILAETYKQARAAAKAATFEGGPPPGDGGV